jgi:predicted glycoside hydrolase/deacetylase ChbG (UPF0249 family)
VDSNSIDKVKYPTNVTRFARCIKAKDIYTDPHGHAHELPQIVYYLPGVGSVSGTSLRGGNVLLPVPMILRSCKP